ncbi:Zn-dependent oligopeptidase [bacterium]|nr:Zn-dependent oligopeptidase [bacterium]
MMPRSYSFLIAFIFSLGGVIPFFAASYSDLPEFERSAKAVGDAMASGIEQADIALDRVGVQDKGERNYSSTLGALDQMYFDVIQVANRAWLIKETSKDSAMREAATQAVKIFDEWAVGLDYREDVYNAVSGFSESKHGLQGERLKLLNDSMRDYRRAGLALPKAKRDEVERLRKKLSSLETDFSSNITKVKAPLIFKKADMAGVPESFLSSLDENSSSEEIGVLANVTFHYLMVMENCSVEGTRRKMYRTRFSLAQKENAPLLQEIVELRATIANKLGYGSWADYKIEPKMAKTGANAMKFVRDLKEGLEPKFQAELASFKKLKVEESGNQKAKIHAWDWRYFNAKLKKDKYSVDTEQMRVFFPYGRTLKGMFEIYEECFGLKIKEVKAPYKWVEDLTLHRISDSASGDLLGHVYLDMFPRDGKYNHFAQFDLIPGKRFENGSYQHPVAALVCNFPPASKDKPSLLSHSEVETLFHEFGHALHTILTTAETATFAGTSVPRDFVEAPSQMLERWVWDKKVLDRFAADYRDPSKKIPAELLEKMKAAKLATIGTHYRRQLAFGTLDLVLHSEVKVGGGVNVVKRSNEVLSEVFLPVPNDSSFVTFFGHLMGYDAGYYGYAWADAIAADLATVFEESDGAFMNKKVGMRLRQEIYAPGESREVTESIKVFLKRPQSIDPFLKSIGIGK